MKNYDVFLSEDALNDLHNGTEFYNRQEQGAGDYFRDCLIADFESLTLCAGVHKKVSGFHQMFAKRFPYTIYFIPSPKVGRLYPQYCPCAEIQNG